MFMMLYPLLYWLIALDMMGLSSIMETWLTPTSPSDKDEWPAMPTRKPCVSGKPSAGLSLGLAKSKI